MSINPRLSIKTIVRDDEDTLSLSGAMAIAPYSYDKAGNNQNNNAIYNLLHNQMQENAG